MTNISRKPLAADKQAELFSELSRVIAKLTEPNIRLFLTELLGPEEKVMIIKRFSAVVLLEKGYSINQVARTLQLSTSTLNKLHRNKTNGKFNHISQWVHTNGRQVTNFLKLIDSLFTLNGALPYYGKQAEAVRRAMRR